MSSVATNRKRRLLSALMAGTAVCAASFVHLSAAGADSLDQENKEAEALLSKLSAYEEQILNKNASGPVTFKTLAATDAMHVSSGDPKTLEKRLKDALDDRNILAGQQEKLVDEIMRLRHRLHELESAPPPIDARSLSKAEQTLQVELEKERQRANGLEKEITHVKEEQRAARDARGALSAIRVELESERAKSQKLETGLHAAQEGLLAAKKTSGEVKDLSGKFVESRRSAEQLELELEAKKQVESDNQSLRVQMERLNLELTQLRKSSQEKENIAEEIQKLREELAKKESEVAEIKEQLNSVKKSAQDNEQELQDAKRQLSKAIQDTRVCELSVDDKQKLLHKLPELEQALSGTKEQLAAKEKEMSECKRQVSDHQQLASRAQELEKNLIATKNELMLKDTEMKLLGRDRGHAPDARARLQAAYAQQFGRANPRREQEVAMGSDVMIVEVTAGKVNLRSGPGDENAPVMQVPGGTRLTVEDREGDWFRVFTPQGSRAYIRRDVVRVVEDAAKKAAVLPQAANPVVDSLSAGFPESQALRSAGGRPLKPVQRSRAEPKDLVPFGDVKLSTDKPQDAESRAFEKLRAGFEKKTAAASSRQPEDAKEGQSVTVDQLQ